MKHFISRKIILAGILLIINTISFSQKRQNVHSFIKKYHDVAWHNEQRDLWEKELKKQLKDEEAWCNYYNAIRTASVLKGWKAEDDTLTKTNLMKAFQEKKTTTKSISLWNYPIPLYQVAASVAIMA